MNFDHYPNTPRLVNRFALGTDPEFVFTSRGGQYVYAENLRLTTLHGFGCDMAGRQAEIRAYPSRFAVEVVASILDSLRWMSRALPNTLDYNWHGTAWNGTDGCGGHIHFGRKRPNREEEVQVLDTLSKTMLAAKVFNRETFEARQVGRGHFGKYGDWRAQAHGYEYRVPPTGMSSPWLTYFMLVAAKLAVVDGTKFKVGKEYGSNAQLLELFQKYQSMDDDAAIVLAAIQRHGFPAEYSNDFKPKWGVSGFPLYDELPTFVPSSIMPDPLSSEDVFNYLVKGIPIPNRKPRAMWKPFKLPSGFQCVDAQTHCMGYLHDVAKDLVSKDILIYISLGNYTEIYSPIQLPTTEIANVLGTFERIKFRPIKDSMITVVISPEFNRSQEQCKKLHEAIGNPELFPACKAKNIEAVDWSKWASKKSTSKPMLGKLLASKKGVPAQPTLKQYSAQCYQSQVNQMYDNMRLQQQGVIAQAQPQPERPARRYVVDIENDEPRYEED